MSDRPFQAIASLQRSNEERRQAAMKERSKVSRKFSKLKKSSKNQPKALLTDQNGSKIGADLRSRFTTKSN